MPTSQPIELASFVHTEHFPLRSRTVRIGFVSQIAVGGATESRPVAGRECPMSRPAGEDLGLFDAHDKSPKVGFRPAFLGGRTPRIGSVRIQTLSSGASVRDRPACPLHPQGPGSPATAARLALFCTASFSTGYRLPPLGFGTESRRPTPAHARLAGDVGSIVNDMSGRKSRTKRMNSVASRQIVGKPLCHRDLRSE